MQCRCAEVLVPGLELRFTAAGRSPVLRCYGRFSAPGGRRVEVLVSDRRGVALGVQPPVDHSLPDGGGFDSWCLRQNAMRDRGGMGNSTPQPRE